MLVADGLHGNDCAETDSDPLIASLAELSTRCVLELEADSKDLLTVSLELRARDDYYVLEVIISWRKNMSGRNLELTRDFAMDNSLLSQ